jgi:rare lipoprotein A
MGFESVLQAQTYVQYGKASFYARKFNGRRTTSGERFSNSQMTGAHRTLPFNSIVRVTNLDNNKSVEVRINDRGPKSHKRIIDVTRKAAKELDIIKQGIGNVKVEVLLLYLTKADSDTIIMKARIAQHAIDTTIYPDSAGQIKSQWYKVLENNANPAGYGIQVGSFSLYNNMMKEIDTIQKMFSYPILVQNTKVNDQIFYRVILGPFDSKAQAQQVILEIKKKKIQGFIVLLKP